MPIKIENVYELLSSINAMHIQLSRISSVALNYDDTSNLGNLGKLKGELELAKRDIDAFTTAMDRMREDVNFRYDAMFNRDSPQYNEFKGKVEL